jgi:hypothetical protein
VFPEWSKAAASTLAASRQRECRLLETLFDLISERRRNSVSDFPSSASSFACRIPKARLFSAILALRDLWVGHHGVPDLARQHGITDRAETVEAMRAGLTAALAHATAPY